MRTRPLLVTALVVLTVSVAHAWPPTASRPAPVPTLDQLIDRLAELRAQETELQARRADLERQVRDRLAEQSRRLQQVGVSPAAVVAPVLPPFHAVDVDLPPLPAAKAQGPANVGFPTDLAPPPVALPESPYVLTVGEPASFFANRPGWVRPTELDDRLDALGGMPLAYTRWQRDNDFRSRRGLQPFSAGYAGLFGGN